MYRPTFNGCWAKIQRAKEHRDAIHRLSQETFGNDRSNWPHVGVRYDAKTGENVLYVSHAPDVSSALHRASVIAGDSIYNLRCALDYLVFELAMWNTGGNLKAPHRTQFPIVSSPGEWKDATKRWLSEVHPFHKAMIKWYQAHERPEIKPHPLLPLRELNDTDKHRLLNVTMVPGSGIANGAPIAPLMLISSVFQGRFQHTRVELGAEIARLKLPVRHLDMEMAGYVPPRIAFDDGTAVIERLDNAGVSVIRIIRRFCPLR